MASFEVIEQQGLKMIKATINNETIRAESGALHYMLGDIKIESKAPSGKSFIKSFVTSENIFRPTYTGTGTIFYGPPIFGEYFMLNLNNEEWVLDRGAYVCSDIGIEVGVFTNKAVAAFFSGEGMFQTKVSGSGTVVAQAPGPLQVIDLKNERLSVDGRFAVARQAHLDFTVRRAAQTLLSSATSGEGLLNVIEGTGRVYLAPVPNMYVSLMEKLQFS